MLKIVVLGMSRGVRTESVDGQSLFTLTRVKEGCHKNLAFRVVGLLVEFHSLPRLLKIIMCVTNFRLFSSSGLALVFPICDTHVTQFLHVPDRPCGSRCNKINGVNCNICFLSFCFISGTNKLTK